jgi:hypothetical protein
VSFSVPAEAYDRFMGRYSGRLAPGFARFAGVEPGQRGYWCTNAQNVSTSIRIHTPVSSGSNSWTGFSPLTSSAS